MKTHFFLGLFDSFFELFFFVDFLVTLFPFIFVSEFLIFLEDVIIS
jgi:hypothetical protein